MANVYGVKVPHSEGRAGMVAFNCDPNSFDWNAFQSKELGSQLKATIPALPSL